MAQRILFIEEDRPITNLIKDSLEAEGFEVTTVEDGLDGLTSARQNRPDLLLVDVVLPRLTGLDILRAIRRESSVPLIMLASRSEEIDRVIALELGADDYVTLPFGTRELAARVRAAIRRSAPPPKEESRDILYAGGIVMDVAKRSVTVLDKAVHLPLKQFELLKVLVINRGRVVTREILFHAIWNTDTTYDTGTLDVHVRWLRKNIEPDPSKPRYILTVRGIGYKLVTGDEM
jgi:two-component system, OmpR family, response regulator RegX3